MSDPLWLEAHAELVALHEEKSGGYGTGEDALANVLVKWANDEMPTATYETSTVRGPTPLDVFDSRVERARYYLEAAHACFEAWSQDNPEDGAE